MCITNLTKRTRGRILPLTDFYFRILYLMINVRKIEFIIELQMSVSINGFKTWTVLNSLKSHF